MNKTQTLTVGISLLAVAGFIALAALNGDLWILGYALATIATGGLLVYVFARGDALARLRKGTAVVSLAASVVTAVRARLSWDAWPVALGLAGSELLAGLAIVVLLSLFQRKPRKAVVFARGSVIARLQRGAIVLALVASALTLAVVPLNRQVRRLSPGRLAEIDAASGIQARSPVRRKRESRAVRPARAGSLGPGPTQARRKRESRTSSRNTG
jgi:hypothetical protein